jgi:hypothetical protein
LQQIANDGKSLLAVGDTISAKMKKSIKHNYVQEI